MRNLLEFLARFGSFFLFLILEAICLFLIVRSNEAKEQTFFNSANAVSGFFYRNYHSVAGYFGLRKQIELLQKENSDLLSRLDNAQYNPQYQEDTIAVAVRKQDSIYSQALRRDSLSMRDTLATQMYTFIPAGVISNSINITNNTITIDRGGLQGVAPSMGVIGPQGVVGIVRDTSHRYASVLSILHSQVSVSASIRHKGYFGALVWRSGNPKFMNLEAIPNHAPVAVGDTVVTSGFSGVFPADIFIGTVVSSENMSDNFKKIRVELASDMANVSHVYVVRHKWIEELRQLQKQEGRQ